MGFTFQQTHFNRGTNLFQAVINIATLQTSSLLNASPYYICEYDLHTYIRSTARLLQQSSGYLLFTLIFGL